MITDYEIKEYNNTQVLFLYFDLKNEFGNFNFKEEVDNLKDVIKKFIIDHKITFLGTTIAIVIGGHILGHVYFNHNELSTINMNNTIAIKEVVKNTDYKVPAINFIEEKSLKEIPSMEVEQTSPIINDTNPTTSTNSEIKDEIKEENVNKEDKIYVALKRKNGEIVNIELEDYVTGVVAAEMPALFHIEALKAQAVLARTYALKGISDNKVLTDNETNQTYKNNDELKSMWGENYDEYLSKIKEAVSATKSMYLSYNGNYIEAVYHSTSNGMTEDAANVWGNSYSYLVSIDSPYDELNPSFLKETFISYKDISSKLGIAIDETTNFDVLTRSKSNRILSILVGEKIYSGKELRNLLSLRSTDIEFNKSEKGITFVTRGYGHGVGLSQYGANGFAKVGLTYHQILEHYYPGTTLNHL